MSGKIYLDACPIIDMAENEAKPSKDREMDVWLCKQALTAARDGKVQVYTSMLSVAECTTIAPALPSPPAETRRFLDMLLRRSAQPKFAPRARTRVVVSQPWVLILGRLYSATDLKKKRTKLKHLSTRLHRSLAYVPLGTQ